MTLPVAATTSAAAQAYQAIYNAAATSATGNASSAGIANSAFSSAAASPLSGSTGGSMLNSSLLGALLNMNNTAAGAPDSATTAPDSTGSGAAAQHRHGLSAYLAQLADAAGSLPG